MIVNNYVYFILNKDKQKMKIGQTKDLRTRIRRLKRESEDELFFCFAFEDTLVERFLHDYFADERLDGEWFACSERLLEMVERTKRRNYLVLPHDFEDDILLDCPANKALKRRWEFYFKVFEAVSMFDVWVMYCSDVIRDWLRFTFLGETKGTKL